MIKQALKKITVVWNKFFFEPISPATIGLFRIGSGLVAFLSTLGRYPYRELFYSDAGIVSLHTMDQFFPPYPWLFFRWVPNGDPLLNYYFLGILFLAIFVTIGLCTRASMILLFLAIISLSNRNFFVDNAGDHLLRINLFFLMFSQAGEAYSIDRLIRIKRGKEKKPLTPKNPWAQRMLQLQLAYVYIDTVYLKLAGSGWRDGTAMYYALNYLELKRFSLKPFFYYYWQIIFATYGTLIAETAMGTLVWFRKLRYWVLTVGFLLHLGINLTMQFPVFQYVMMASMINFIYPEDIEKFFLSLRRAQKKKEDGMKIRVSPSSK